jgi:CRP/FNR family transcriptional regulator
VPFQSHHEYNLTMAVEADAVVALLKRVQIFSGLSEQESGFLASRMVPRRFQAGEIIFNEGDACAGLYLVQNGNVRIFKSSAGGREQVLAIDGPGSSIAELPVFDGGNYPASAQAVNECGLLFLSRQDFQALCLQHPQVALKVLRVVGGRLRRLVGIIEELSFTTVRHRLIALLVRLAKSEGSRNGDVVTVLLPANNSELAAQIGTVRELVSRNLSRLQADGLIQVDNRDLKISSLKKLEAELESAGG